MNMTVLRMKTSHTGNRWRLWMKLALNRVSNRLCRALLTCVLVLAAMTSGTAAASQQMIVGSDVFTGVGLLARVAAESGGGQLLTVSDSNGDAESLTGGTGNSIELGVRLDLRPFERPAFETEFTVGYKRNAIDSGSDASEFTYSTLAVSQYYRFKVGVRLGAGIGLRLFPNLDVNVQGFQTTSTTLDNAPELRLMLDYGFLKRFAIGARLAAATWESNGESVDGSSAGLYLSVRTR